MQERTELLEAGKSLINLSRSLIQKYSSGTFDVGRKSDQSVVTEVDLRVEEALRKKISNDFPEHGIVGEEFDDINSEADFQWILDPIDGTEQFVAGMPTFGTIVSLHYCSNPLIGIIDHPAVNHTISAGKDLGLFINNERREGTCSESNRGEREVRIVTAKRENFMRWEDQSPLFDKMIARFPYFWVFDNCYSHTCVISGFSEAMIECNVKRWDIAATQILVEEAGGKYLSLGINERPGGVTTYSAVFGCPSVVDELYSILG